MKALAKLLIVALLITTPFFSSKAQNFAPIGATWHYEIGNIWGGSNYAQWTSIKDTLILGKNTRKIIHSSAFPSLLKDSIIYIYEDSGVVYKYLEQSNAFDTLYNFNASANDSWVMDVDTNCSLQVVVDSTAITTINGFNLKVLYVSTVNGEFSGTIIEKIGHLFTPLPDINFLCYTIAGGSSYYNGLRCYSDSIIGNYSTAIAVSCDTITSNIKNYKANNTIKIYPNPANSNFTVSYNLNTNKDAIFILYDIAGKEVMRKTIINAVGEMKLFTRELNAGVYFYSVSMDDTIIMQDN